MSDNDDFNLPRKRPANDLDEPDPTRKAPQQSQEESKEIEI